MINTKKPSGKAGQAPLDVERQKLEREQERLLQAHYSDAIPLELMKREQDRISSALRHNATQAARLREDLEHNEKLRTILRQPVARM